MKHWIHLLILATFILCIGADKNGGCFYRGKIIGWSNARCMCCQGVIIEINGEQFKADSIPNADKVLGPEEKRVYPIDVYLDYVMADHCGKIVITCINKK